MNDPLPDERRRAQRYDLDLSVKLAGDKATMRNISSTGLYVLANESFEPGADVDIEVFFPSLGGETNRLTGVGRVIRTCTEAQRRFGIGLKFTSWQFA